jgi:large subunit ribosomal protein L25
MHVLVKAPATALPEAIEVDVTGLEEGQHVTVADLKLPQDVDIELDPQTVVVVVSLPEVDTALEEADAAAAEAASAEAAAAAGTEEE